MWLCNLGYRLLTKIIYLGQNIEIPNADGTNINYTLETDVSINKQGI